jgi:Cu(I)/Ag(I) efflux system membrane fusion protein
MRVSVLAGGLLLAAAAFAAGAGYWRDVIDLGRGAAAPSSAAAQTAAPAAPPAGPAAVSDAEGCDVAYYRNPMGLPDISYVPKQDNMGMDYIAVCAEAEDTGLVVPPGRQQALGVTLVEARRQDLVRWIEATGLVAVNQRAVSVVAPRVEGWIEELLVDATGDRVLGGAPLARVYSPDLIQAQVNYRVAAQDGAAKSAGLAERLRLLGLADSEIARLAAGGDVAQTAVLVAPRDGTVMQKMATDGMYFAAGTPLLEIADLSVVWVIAEVYERDLSLIVQGAPVEVLLDSYPARSFTGTVQAILPEIMLDTRTAQVRVELANAEGLLRPGMFARVRLRALAAADAVVVPRSAVLDAGRSQVVLVALGDGRFEARPVVLGAAADGLVEVREGLRAGEQLVEAAAFLIDAESNMRAALQAFVPPAAAPAAAPVAAPVAAPAGQTP